RLEWVRDPVQVHAFHVNVPNETKTIDNDFQFLSTTESKQARIVMTPDMLSLQWTATTLYPAGYFARDIMTSPSVKFPQGFHYASALEPVSTSGTTTTFKNVPYNTLIDSPMIAGRYFTQLDLDPNGPAPVHLDVIADRPDELSITPQQLAI